MIKSSLLLPKYRTAIFLALALFILYFISRHNYLLFHSFADGISIVIAACVFAIIWNGRRIADNDYFLYVGIALLFFAFWNLMHLLGNKNMGVFPQYGNLGPALYIVSRYILSISLLIAPLFINRKLNTIVMYAAYSLVTLLILLSIFSWQIFPICIIEGAGLTPFKVVSDYIICLILLSAIGLLLKNRRSFDSRVLWLIVASIILSIATGLAFTLYADPFGIMNATGHFLQIAAFYLIYLAFIETSLTKPQDILYQKLKQSEAIFAENVLQLNAANAALKQEIAERKRADEALRESEGRYALTLEAVNDGLWDWDVVSGNAFFSPHYYSMLGYDNGDFQANYTSWRLLVHPEDLDRVEEELRLSIEKGKGFAIDLQMKLKSGGWRWVSTRGKVVALNAEGKALRMVGTLSDVTERKQAEEKIQASLLEKETLLKEIHHRVKNNLAIISSLLNMQSSYLQDEKAKEGLQASIGRVRTMANIHTQLYQSQDLNKVDFGLFIRDLISNISQSYGRTESPIKIGVDAPKISLDIDNSIPCGLILNELVANSLKHAFPEGKEGKINITLRLEENQVVLIVSDNGIGFLEPVDRKNLQSLGMELVNILVRQMNGKIDMQVHEGTTWTIAFPLKKERE